MIVKDNMWRQRRLTVPRRTSELVALVALSSTLFLFLHTRDLHSRLREMEVRLQPGEGEPISGNQLSSEDGHPVQTGQSASATSNAGQSQNSQRQTSMEMGCSELMVRTPKTVEAVRNAIERSPDRSARNHDQALRMSDTSIHRVLHDSNCHPYNIAVVQEMIEPLENLDIDALNNTRRADKHVLFFNRVPKVGSQSLMHLLRRLASRNGFSFNRDEVQRVETIRLTNYEQRRLVKLVNSYAEPSVYVKHVCFTNFTEFNLPRPIYMNVVRDPVERVISWYYYVRASWYYVERKQLFPDLPLPDPAWLKKDFETCVLAGDRECRYVEGESHEGIGDHRRQTLFFCGHSEDCMPFNTIGALDRAKHSVEKHYAVVGILEDMNATLAVLENYIPQFFEGATELYHDDLDSFKRINRNSFKPPVSEEVKDIVRRHFTREIEFYQFCKQRLYRQLRALKISNVVPTVINDNLV